MASIGIYLGTTNSAAAHCRPGTKDPKILSTRTGDRLTPSVVAFRKSKRDPEETILVGRAALNYAQSAPEETILSIKRLMGRTLDEPRVAEVREKFNYTIVPTPGEDPGLCVRLGGKEYTPVEISAMILKQIKEDAERALGEEVTHAVVTVPAYFEERQRAATREAGQQAGLVIKKIIDEPTAAAIAFGVQSPPGERHRILVYDLGGGTFDISILQMVTDEQGKNQVQVLNIEGDNWLGGDDFDRKIAEKVLAEVKEEYGLDLSADKRFLFLAKYHAEMAKRALSEAPEADIIIPAGVRTEDGGLVDVEVLVTREEFEGMIGAYVDHTMALVEKALREQDLTPDDISDVLLVGGSTLIPVVYETVESFFGPGKIKRTINPMECVALGAGVLAATLQGVKCANCKTINDEAATECVECGESLATARSVGDTGITEVTAMSLGIAYVRGQQKDAFEAIIKKGTPYPLREPKKETFLPTSGNLIRVPVYEGDDPVASKNEQQGVVEYELPEEIDVNTPVEVSFNYDRHRQLTVTIRVQGTTYEKTETLRRNRPRATPEEEEELWQEELDHLVTFMKNFVEHYGQYMEVNQRRKVEQDAAKAQQLLFFPDEMEGRKLIRVLQMHVFNSGLATQIYLAERVTERAEPEVAQKVRADLDKVRRAHAANDIGRVQAITHQLRTVVAQAMARRTEVQEPADQGDLGELLRIPEETLRRDRPRTDPTADPMEVPFVVHEDRNEWHGSLIQRELKAASALKELRGFPLPGAVDGELVCGPLMIQLLGLHTEFGRFVAAIQIQEEDRGFIHFLQRLFDSGMAPLGEHLPDATQKKRLMGYFSQLGAAQALLDASRPEEALQALSYVACGRCRAKATNRPRSNIAPDRHVIVCRVDCPDFDYWNPGYAGLPDKVRRLQRDAIDLVIETHLAVAQSVITTAAMDTDVACARWQQALALSATLGAGATEQTHRRIVDAALGRAQALQGKGHLDEAIVMLEGAERVCDDRFDRELVGRLAELFTNRGIIAGNEEQWEAAVNDLRRAIALSPHIVRPLLNLCIVLRMWARQYYEEGQEGAAMNLLKELIRQAEASLNVHPNHSKLQEEIREARSALSAIYNDRGVRQTDRGSWTKALDDLETALRYEPRNAVARENLRRTYSAYAASLTHRGNLDAAVEVLQKGLDCFPGDRQLIENLAQVQLLMLMLGRKR